MNQSLSAPVVTRRGAFLLLIGGIYAVVGFAYAAFDLSPNATAAYAMALTLAPMHVWGTVWCLSGVCAAVTGFWPPSKDAWGFMVLAGWSALWAVLCACSTLFMASDRGWISGLIWGAFGGACMIVSGMDADRGERV